MSRLCLCHPGSDHELRRAAGGPGVRHCEGALQGAEPCHPIRMHRHHCGPPAQWEPAVFPFPRALREDGGLALPGEGGEWPGAGGSVMYLELLEDPDS